MPTRDRPRRAATRTPPVPPRRDAPDGPSNARRLLKLFGCRGRRASEPHSYQEGYRKRVFYTGQAGIQRHLPSQDGGHPLGWRPWPAARSANRTFRTARPLATSAGSRSPERRRPAPHLVRKAIDAARKDLAASAPSSVDASFARRLMERADQTEAAGDLGKALDLARASRRTLEIAKRKARVVDVLARSDTILEEARQAGIETLAFQRNIEQAKALTARGDFVTAEGLLRRVSTRTLDQRRERILQALLDKAGSQVRYAKERGGNVADAEALLADARKALALRDYGKIRSLCAKAIEKAEQQRKYARAEDVLDRAAADVDAARKDGVNITEARKVLTQARDALRRGVFADIPLLAQRARNSLREARRYAAADVSLRESEREAARER